MMEWLFEKIIGPKITIALVMALIPSVVGLIHYYTKSIENRIAYDSAMSSITEYADSINQAYQAQSILEQEYQNARNIEKTAMKVYDGKDFDKLAKGKPGLIVNFANRRTDRLYSMVEEESGYSGESTDTKATNTGADNPD